MSHHLSAARDYFERKLTLKCREIARESVEELSGQANGLHKVAARNAVAIKGVFQHRKSPVFMRVARATFTLRASQQSERFFATGNLPRDSVQATQFPRFMAIFALISRG